MKKKNKTSRVFLWTIILYILVMAAAAVLVWIQLGRYEQGILDVCATQQDGYVQLVLDQINLKENREDEEIINDILGTLDASNNRYWTFARGESMVFIKDVLETNKYKNLNSDSYYSSNSAKDFLDHLELDRVTHQKIEVDGIQYIASGVTFAYNGGEYGLCLLTNRSILLDNNNYLSARVEMIVTLIVFAAFAFISAALLSHRLRKTQIALAEQKEAAFLLNRRVESLNQYLAEREVYLQRERLWNRNILPVFAEKLSEKDCWPLTAALLDCGTSEQKQQISAQLGVIYIDQVLSFDISESRFLALFLQTDHEETIQMLEFFRDPDLKILRSGTFRKAEEYRAERLLSFAGADSEAAPESIAGA